MSVNRKVNVSEGSSLISGDGSRPVEARAGVIVWWLQTGEQFEAEEVAMKKASVQAFPPLLAVTG
jgi:hypothetical protein